MKALEKEKTSRPITFLCLLADGKREADEMSPSIGYSLLKWN
jgi:hypothetical protein